MPQSDRVCQPSILSHRTSSPSKALLFVHLECDGVLFPTSKSQNQTRKHEAEVKKKTKQKKTKHTTVQHNCAMFCHNLHELCAPRCAISTNEFKYRIGVFDRRESVTCFVGNAPFHSLAQHKMHIINHLCYLICLFHLDLVDIVIVYAPHRFA